MEKIKLKKGQQFRVDTIEELKEAYYYFKDDWDIDFPLEAEIRDFTNNENKRYVTMWDDDGIWLDSESGNYEIITNPFKQKPMSDLDKIAKELQENLVKLNASIERMKKSIEDEYPPVGSICEVWDDDENGLRFLYYYKGDGCFSSAKDLTGNLKWKNFKVIKEA